MPPAGHKATMLGQLKQDSLVGEIRRKLMMDVYLVFLYNQPFPAFVYSAGRLPVLATVTHTAISDAHKCILLHFPL